uniref:Anti-H(O) lectin 2 n=1 Tax=Cytisophyllum sessilifolium TaxID=3834 RepID=LEC2_CYTSE|nr:RecName: Full=Anti-H(O) lectin 2; AltName: Full=Anti-H(O) lectin II; AltName: Full=CSA-II [Cytisophyllum sessilifolium]AAB34948.1 anti-H(O) lectin II, CSA-II [Cytisus sessilifolius, seeds, Peptide, 243 aa] [Cytisophyllum sessilifolium]prf//2113311A lactose-binding anti-H(O) lectin [Cytisophyllum sessilifolium]
SNDISFKFDKFDPNGKQLTFQGYASVLDTGVLQLNKVGTGLPKEIGGIARYVAPFQIWSKATGEVASFVTSFQFFLETSPNPANGASDGLTFFLAPPNSPLRRAGGYLGLFETSNKSDSSYQTVAVEFDTVGAPANTWDPGYPHIGVDVNRVTSIKTTKEKWNKRYKREVANVWITYQASSKTLTASLTYPQDQTSDSVSVDFKANLPEWVSVGFTGGTTVGGRETTHEILNWYFSSTLEYQT